MRPSEILEAAATLIDRGEFASHARTMADHTARKAAEFSRRGRPFEPTRMGPEGTVAAHAIGRVSADARIVDRDDAHSFLGAFDAGRDEEPEATWGEIAGMDFAPVAARLRAAAALAREHGEEWSISILDAFPDHPYHRYAEAP